MGSRWPPSPSRAPTPAGGAQRRPPVLNDQPPPAYRQSPSGAPASRRAGFEYLAGSGGSDARGRTVLVPFTPGASLEDSVAGLRERFGHIFDVAGVHDFAVLRALGFRPVQIAGCVAFAGGDRFRRGSAGRHRRRPTVLAVGRRRRPVLRPALGRNGRLGSVPGALLLANAMAALPARRAARCRRPADRERSYVVSRLPRRRSHTSWSTWGPNSSLFTYATAPEVAASAGRSAAW